MLFRRGDKLHLVTVANRFMMVGLGAVAVAIVGVVLLVSDVMFGPAMTAVVTTLAALGCTTTWFVLPLSRRRRLESDLDGSVTLPDPDSLHSVLTHRFDADRVPVRGDRVSSLR